MTMQTVVPVMRPVAPPLSKALPRLRNIELSGRFSNFGEQEVELRERFAHWFNVPADRVATAANATLGLTGAIASLESTKWIVPAFTFPATPAAVLNAGKTLRLADIDSTWWLDATKLGRMDSIVPVAPFGGDLELQRWAHRERVVLDAAASIGCQPDLSELREEWAVVFSLHATKVLGAGEGGLVVFGSPDSARRFRAWTNFGFTGTRQSQHLATNAKMSEIQAAFAHAALDAWPTELVEWTAARQLLATVCDELGVDMFESSRSGVNPYFIARFTDAQTTAHVETTLRRRGIESRRWWSDGCHRMPAFRGFATGPMPETEHAAATSLGLPFFRQLSDEDTERVAEALALSAAG